MNFTFDGADLSQTIKRIYNENNEYGIEYLDGSYDEYTCNDQKELDRLFEIFIDQAKERDENINLKPLIIKNVLEEVLRILSAFSLGLAIKKEESSLVLVYLASLIYVTANNRKTKKQIKELKKYKLFLELASDLKNVNTSKILKCVERDPKYQVPLDPTTLDDYSYGYVKKIYKTYKKNNTR